MLPTIKYSPNNLKLRKLALPIGALGIVFGDIGTSPMIALAQCFNGTGLGLSTVTIMGAISLIFWALILVVCVKYMLFVTHADNEGEGGVFALVALLKGSGQMGRGISIFSTGIALMGAALLFADSLITPPLAIMAAIEGLKIIFNDIDHWIIISSLAILVVLFIMQRFGTEFLSRVFGPIMLIWFLVIALLGVLQIMKAPQILYALLPHHALHLLATLSFHQSFSLLGSVMLAVTGAEAIYADMGHFGREPIKVAWYGVALTALMLNYLGQGAWLLGIQGEDIKAIQPFFALVAKEWIVPMVILSTMAGIIASQAVISGMFSLASQAVQLHYLPRLQIIQTSALEKYQIYVPKINALLMLGSVVLVLAFGSSSALASAYGFAVAATMLLTSLSFTLVIYYVWRWSWFKIIVFCFFAIPLDLTFFAATVTKIPDGSYVSVLVSMVAFWLLVTWILGNRYLTKRAQRLDMSIPLLAELIGQRDDLYFQARPAVFFQHLQFPPDMEIAPNALLRQIQLTSMVYQPTVVVEFNSVNTPRVPENTRIKVINYANNLHLLCVSFGFAETINIKAIECYGQEQGWWDNPDEIVYFSAREDFQKSTSKDLPSYIKWPFMWLHNHDETMARTLNLPALQYVELSMTINI